MPRRSTKCPENANVVATYAQFEELIAAFIGNHFDLLVIVGRPGLSKSQSLRTAIGDAQHLLVKGRKSALDFYTSLYIHKDLPIVLDDADDLMGNKLCREYVKALTETDAFKRLDWGTKTKVLDHENVPAYFWTESKVCIITNFWSSNDAVFQALESRAEFLYFDPDWNEMYRYVGNWFWDQEIYDYVHERIDVLRQPDARLFVKAFNRKRAGMKQLDWRQLIDDYCDDSHGIAVRELLDDDSFPHNTARAEAFCERTGASRPTFYRRKADIKRYRPSSVIPRIILEHSDQPVTERPKDGFVPSDDGEPSDRAYKILGPQTLRSSTSMAEYMRQ